MLKQLNPKLPQSALDEAERTIAKEVLGQDKVRGSIEKAMFEDDL